MREVTIIADDLTGAADCALAFSAAGLPAFVSLGDAAVPASARVVAVDTDTRPLPADVAADRTGRAARRALREGTRATYKKIDSTLRGNVGPEIAATFQAAVEAAQGRRPLVLLAPAFPGTGRTTRDGRILVGGVPLEETEVWRASGMTGPADPVAILRLAGLATFTLRQQAVQLGADRLARELAQVAAGGVEAVVCDAESEDDLAAIAEAGARLPVAVVWAGSAGLARHLPRALGLVGRGSGPAAPARERRPPTRASGPLLFLVGSRSEIAREQARQLQAEPGVVNVVVSPHALLEGEGSAAWSDARRSFRGALDDDQDVLVQVSGAHVCTGRERDVAAGLARLVAGSASGLGGLVATGGDIARAALAAMGAGGIRLLDEVEPGVPLGMAEEPSPLPVVTKAGAFGDRDTLRRCRAALKD